MLNVEIVIKNAYDTKKDILNMDLHNEKLTHDEIGKKLTVKN